MSTDLSTETKQPTPELGYGYPAALAWIAAVVFGLGTGAAAAMLQRWFSPIGVFPLAIGMITGFATGGVWAGRGGGTKRAVVVSALVAGLLCVAAWHAASFLIAKRVEQDEQRKVREAMFKLAPDPSFQPVDEPPATIQSYLTVQWHHGRALGPRRITRWWLLIWWIGDLALVVTASVLAAVGVGKPRGAARPNLAAGVASPPGPNQGAGS